MSGDHERKGPGRLRGEHVRLTKVGLRRVGPFDPIMSHGESELDNCGSPGISACTDDPISLRISHAGVLAVVWLAIRMRIGPAFEAMREPRELTLDQLEQLLFNHPNSVVHEARRLRADSAKRRPRETRTPPPTAGYPCDPQLSRTSNTPLWAFITVKYPLATSGQILVATNTPAAGDRSTTPRSAGGLGLTQGETLGYRRLGPLPS